MKITTLFITLAIIVFIGADGRRIRRSDDTTAGEKELRRTKRNIYQALLKRKDATGFVDLATPEATKKPQMARHTREIRFEILLNHKWREEMTNRTTPEFKLLSGNIIDAIRNELNADFNYLTSIVSKLRKGNKGRVLADIASKFFITEVNPERHLQGIVSRGWISGQSVDPYFFKVIAIQKKVGNNSDHNRSRPVKLHIKAAAAKTPTGKASGVKTVNPSTLTKENPTRNPSAASLENPTPKLSNTKSKNPTDKPDGSSNPTKAQSVETPTKPSFYLQYKEIDISVKLAQNYQEYLKDKQSPEFQELSGNVEHAVKKVLSSNEFFLNCTVIEFSESPDGKVICMMSIKFRHEEKFAIEKCQALIANGNIDGMPVDDHFFRVNSLGETDEQGENMHQLTSIDEKIPQPVPSKYKLKLLPLHYVEIRFSIKINETWNDDLADNQTVRYTVFSGQIEQAVDRSLSENPNYIDCNVLEFMESNDQAVVTNIAVRLHNNETQPEQVVRNMLTNGTLSGIPIDSSFFAVFSISYRIKTPEESQKVQKGATMGQKQQAQSINQTSPDQINNTVNLPKIYQTPCQQQQQLAEEAMIKGNQIGIFVPQCQPDGSFKPVQCHALTGFCWCVDNTGTRIQGTEQRYKEPFCQGIRIHGNIQSNTTLVVSTGSCLTMYVQEQVACGDGVDCHIPLTANQTFHNITSINNQVAYDFMIPRTKPGTYVISAILNIGWCRSNSLDTSKLVHDGDFHTTDADDFIIDAQTADVEKTLFVEVITPEELGINLHGNIILPEGETASSFDPQSCISVETKLLKACTGRKCGKLPESSNHTVDILPTDNRNIPYEVRLNDMREGTYVISVVIHTKKCASEDSQAISDGDFYNEEMQEFTITMDTNDIEKDIPVVKLNDTESGTSISGRVLFPPDIKEILNGSCLSVSSRKLIKCKNNHCKIPPVASKTWEMVEYDSRGIPYSLFLPVSSPGSYLISAVINNGWCKTHAQGVWIREGDLYNDKVIDFEIKSPAQPIGKNIQISIYTVSNDQNDTKGAVGHDLIINGHVTLPGTPFLSSRSCMVIKVQPFDKCANNHLCVVGKQVFRELHLEGNSLAYFVTIINATTDHYVINAILNVDWCSDDTNNVSMKTGDYFNQIPDDLHVKENQTEAECNIDLARFDDKVINGSVTMTTSAPTYIQTNVMKESVNQKITSTSVPPTHPPTAEQTNSFFANKENLMKPMETPNYNTNISSSKVSLNKMTSSPPSFTTNSPNYSIANNFSAPLIPINTTDSPVTFSLDNKLPVYSTNNPYLAINSTNTEAAINSTNTEAATSPPIFSPTAEFDDTTSNASNTNTMTSSFPPNSHPSTNGSLDTAIPSFDNNTKTNPVTSTDGLVALPKGLPKSCSEIRSSGIGSMDGQYIVEARENCHLSIICQDMEGQNPKEFLGGPSEDEWKYWHFAVLIKISQQDKENIPEGACLEKSDRGQDLLRRILEAGARQDNPINEWKSNLAKLLRSRRGIPEASSIITKAKTIYKESKPSDWGVL